MVVAEAFPGQMLTLPAVGLPVLLSESKSLSVWRSPWALPSAWEYRLALASLLPWVWAWELARRSSPVRGLQLRWDLSR